MDEARIPPLPIESADESVKPMLEGLARTWGGELPNVFGTLARHPRLFRKWLPFASHVLVTTSLPARDREIAILRTGWRCDCAYEFAQHRVIGAEAGLASDEIEATASDVDAFAWVPRERALIVAVDSLCLRNDLDDAAWRDIRAHYDEDQVLDLVFCVGAYTMLSMALNGFRVRIDDGLVGFDPA